VPRRGVLLYNAWHTFTVPIAIWFVDCSSSHSTPRHCGGWLLHIGVDLLRGFGLPGDDGGQAVF